MSDDEITKIARKVLRREFKGLGLEYVTVNSEEDFDGASIIRVNARLRSGLAPIEKLTTALNGIRDELIANGEDRFVFLSSAQPNNDLVEEELE